MKNKTLLLVGIVGFAMIAASANAATLIGPGADITEATDQDTAGADRLNVDRTFVTLGPGTYSISDWRLNVFEHTVGTITPMLLSGAPSTYTTEWIGAAFDPTSDGVQAVSESGTFTLDASTNIYAGFYTEGTGSGIIALDKNNSGSDSSSTDHDSSFTAPTGIDQAVGSFSNSGLARTYAFEITVIPEPSSAALLLGLVAFSLTLRRRR